ncbi:hypothetical protein BpHYR1_026501 [Brachionus plicatilis]|uniref:Uncharacterized protein n=1 Tax=Brachionus plicatilis TaxID=10195 RepID=A0A3M7PA60_BRAPC|nr:hypothetical protein BpHYR1_026501 [Brachionus plicatilis]
MLNLFSHFYISAPISSVYTDCICFHQFITGKASSTGRGFYRHKKCQHLQKLSELLTNSLFALFLGFSLDYFVRLPAFSVTLLRSVLCKIKVSVALTVFTSPAHDNICAKAQKLTQS